MNDNLFTNYRKINFDANSLPGRDELDDGYNRPPPLPVQITKTDKKSNNSFNIQSHFSNNNNYNGRLLQLDTKLYSFCLYKSIMTTLLVFSILGLTAILFVLSESEYDEEEDSRRFYYDFFVFISDIVHVVAYVYSLHTLSKQHPIMQKNVVNLLLTCAGLNLGSFLTYVFFYTPWFFTWCLNTTYFICNFLIYLDAKEIANILEEKNKLQQGLNQNF